MSNAAATIEPIASDNSPGSTIAVFIWPSRGCLNAGSPTVMRSGPARRTWLRSTTVDAATRPKGRSTALSEAEVRRASWHPNTCSQDRAYVEIQWLTDDETETVTFSVVGVERVLGRGELVGLAIVELTLHGIAITVQGIKIRRLAGDRITVTLPDFRHPGRTGCARRSSCRASCRTRSARP